jgi:hypothetical protein
MPASARSSDSSASGLARRAGAWPIRLAAAVAVLMALRRVLRRVLRRRRRA